MKNNIYGVSLLEILVVIAIFAVVSAGVTSLSVSMIDHQRDEATITKHTNIYNNIHDDLRRDLESATAVWLSNNTTAAIAAGSRNYATITNAAPASINNQNTLDVLIQESGPGSFTTNPTTQYFRLVRYQFNTIDGDPSLIRISTNLTCVNTADQLWPRNLDAGAYIDPVSCGAYPLVASMTPTASAVFTAGGKVYNLDSDGMEDSDISGNFSAQYTIGYSAPPEPPAWFVAACATAPCNTYFLKSISLNGLSIVATGYDSKYDRLFGGKAGEYPPTISFEINPSLKFF